MAKKQKNKSGKKLDEDVKVKRNSTYKKKRLLFKKYLFIGQLKILNEPLDSHQKIPEVKAVVF